MCVKCNGSPWKWIGYIMLLCIPQTIFFLTFLLLRINVHSGSLTGFIFFAHSIITTIFFFSLPTSYTQSLFGYWPTQIVLALYGVWSLNFMRFIIPPFCVSPHLTTLQLVSLGYVSSVFPLILCIATYYLIQLHDRGNWLIVTLWRPFHRLFSSGVESSIIHTFGTFILLSYGNNVFVSFTLIQSSMVVALDVSTNTLKSLPPRSIDLGVDYFDSTHAPYGVLGIMGGLITVILPLVLVLIYPTRVFPKLIACCGLRRWHVMRTFMEVFVGSYKDGLDARVSKRDYRFTASLYLIARVAIGFGWIKPGPKGPPVQHYTLLISAVPCIIGAIFFAFFKPHRKLWHNFVDVVLLLLMAKIFICLHVVIETPVSEYTMRVVVLILLVDIAFPHVILINFFSYNLACWIHSQVFKWDNHGQERSAIEEETCSETQDGLRETQPLLMPS